MVLKPLWRTQDFLGCFGIMINNMVLKLTCTDVEDSDGFGTMTNNIVLKLTCETLNHSVGFATMTNNIVLKLELL